jgi:hypothetical protein
MTIVSVLCLAMVLLMNDRGDLMGTSNKRIGYTYHDIELVLP